MINKTYLGQFCFLSILTSLPVLGQADDLVDQQREISVAEIRAGNTDQGFNQFKALLKQYPDNQKLIADYMALRYANAKFSANDAAYLTQIVPAEFPDYGKVSVIKGLRDLKQYDQALQWTEKFYQTDLSEQWPIWQGVLLAESGQKQRAREKFAQMDLQFFEADYLSQLAYAYRLLDMPADSLHAAQLALAESIVRKVTHGQQLLC